MHVREVTIAGLVVAALAGCAAPSETTQPQARELHVVTAVLGFDEDAVGIPHDIFVPDTLVVSRGDNVTIRFYNAEDEPENHSFTIDGTYAVDEDLGAGERATIAFVANEAGVFRYYCKYHEPTMSGQLVVLG